MPIKCTNNKFKARCHIDYDIIKYLCNKNIEQNKIEAQKHGNVKDTNKILICKKSKNTKFNIIGKLIAPKKESKSNQISA